VKHLTSRIAADSYTAGDRRDGYLRREIAMFFHIRGGTGRGERAVGSVVAPRPRIARVSIHPRDTGTPVSPYIIPYARRLRCLYVPREGRTFLSGVFIRDAPRYFRKIQNTLPRAERLARAAPGRARPFHFPAIFRHRRRIRST